MRRVLLLCGACLCATGVRAEPSGAGRPDMLVVPPAETRDEGGVRNDASPSPPPAEPPAESDAGAQQEPAQDDGVTPQPFPLSRYAPLWERSPFQLESIAPPAESAGLAQKFALTGIAQINGEPIIFLLERATLLRHMLDKKTNTAGLSLVQVDMQQKYAESTAVVRQGAEVGVVKFDPSTSTAAVPAPAGIQPQGRGPRPIQPGMPQATIPVQPQVQGIPGVPFNPTQAIPGQNVQGITAMPGVVPSVPGPQPPADIPGQVQQPQVPGQDAPPPRVIRRRALIPAAP